jgi:hypothetical protein
MSPLHLKVMMGQEDERLLEHLAFLDRAATQGRGLSPNENFLRLAIWERLDMITAPRQGYKPSDDPLEYHASFA